MANDRLTFICTCQSLEHQMWVWYDDEDNTVYFEPYLHTHRNFFQRLWYGLKYAFGHTSNYGAFDEMILNKEDIEKIYEYVGGGK